MKKSRRTNRGYTQLRILLSAMPFLAGLYDAYTVSHGSIDSIFFSELAPRLPLALILASVVYGFVSLVGAFLLRLHGASVAAQASRHQIELARPRDRHGRWRVIK